MDQAGETKIQNREMAGRMLAQKLAYSHVDNAIVVGIPHGGACVASALAEHLHLPLEVMPCRKIKDPSNKDRNIGSVSAKEVVTHDCPQGLPQDYLRFQTIRLRSEIRYENRFYYDNSPEPDLEYKTVIIVDDILKSADTLLACVREIRKQRALKIIVAVPVAETEAARIIGAEVDNFVCLRLKHTIGSAGDHYEEFPAFDDRMVRDLLTRAKGHLIALPENKRLASRLN